MVRFAASLCWLTSSSDCIFAPDLSPVALGSNLVEEVDNRLSLRRCLGG